MIDFKKILKTNVNSNLVEGLYKIHTEVFLNEDKMSFSNFKQEFEQDNRIYFVATNKEELLGYIGVINCTDFFEIIGIAVKKDFQRSGVGSKLLQHIVNTAKENNIEKIFLEVDETNIPAQNFYKKNNFSITNIRKNYYKNNDAFVMMRCI